MDAGAALTKLCGGLLLAAGGIIALSCGLCTGFFGVASIIPLFTGRGGDLLGSASPFLIVGFAATAAGIGLARGGLAILRHSSGLGDGDTTERDG